MSEFSVRVVRIGAIEKHPSADSLSITEVDGCPVLFRTTDFSAGDLAVYVPVDAVVAAGDPRFAFLDGKNRVRAKRLRGVFSMGLLVSAEGLGEGEDVAERWGIKKWEEPEESVTWSGVGLDCRPPPGPPIPVYDVESLRKYGDLLIPGEEVVVTEKVHGCNARFYFHDGELYAGSRNRWKKHEGGSVWWKVADEMGLAVALSALPGYVFYGEVYGRVQDLQYGTKPNEHRLAIFDVYLAASGRFLDADNARVACAAVGLPMVKELYRGPYDRALAASLAEGETTMGGDHIREGVVVRPVHERVHPRHGRVVLKLVSEAYLTRSKGTEHR